MRAIAERNCQGISRREVLRIGGIGALGLELADLFRLQAARAAPAEAAARPTEDISCIFFFLWGGPSQFETFDPKPDAPAEVRGPFAAIPTTVDGLRFCEHLPRLAQLARRFTTLRNLHHDNAQHPQSGSLAQAGRFPVPGQRFPNHGAVVARFGPKPRGVLPPFVRLGPEVWDSAGEVTAQDGGFLGGSCNPFVVEDPRLPLDRIASLNRPPGLSAERLERRRSLLEELDAYQRAVESADTTSFDAAYERAFRLITSPEAKRALDLRQEPDRVRERYGDTLPGQCALLARRLVEAGVRFVQINWCRVVVQGGWDTHGVGNGGSIAQMTEYLLPTLDRSVSALFEDLEQRGLHRNTLVVVGGEFGRTHRLNAKGGRDHWPGVYPALLFGSGVPEGLVVGQSDPLGMYPDGPHCTPADISLTLFRRMGLDVSGALRAAGIVGVTPGIPGVTPPEAAT